MWARERHLTNSFLSQWWNMPTGNTRLLQQNNLERRWRITISAVTVYDDGLAKVVYWSRCLRQTIHKQGHRYFNITVQGTEEFNFQVCFGIFFLSNQPTLCWLIVSKVNLLFHLKLSVSGSIISPTGLFIRTKWSNVFLAENKLCVSCTAWLFSPGIYRTSFSTVLFALVKWVASSEEDYVDCHTWPKCWTWWLAD